MDKQANKQAADCWDGDNLPSGKILGVGIKRFGKGTEGYPLHEPIEIAKSYCTIGGDSAHNYCKNQQHKLVIAQKTAHFF